MRLFIAEKKGLGEVIALALGNGINRGSYIECGADLVTWGSGHLLELVEPQSHNPAYEKWNAADLPLKLRPQRYKPIARTVAQLNAVMALIEKADEIIHAGDPDAEGQLLIDEILTFVGNRKPVKRLLINDLNTEKARQALTRMKDNAEFYGLSQSALARSVGDQLFGFNMTRGYTLASRNKGGKYVLSVGRVQTPILGLIVRRFEAFKNHESGFYYPVSGDFNFKGKCISARFIVPEGAPVDDKNRLIDKRYAQGIAETSQGKPAQVTQVTTESKATAAPLPFSLLDLQVHMSREHGLSAEKTLAITQSLRDKFKAITYNRSDCRYLSTEQFNDAPQTIAAVETALVGTSLAAGHGFDSSIKSRAFNDSKVSAHTAIIPTSSAPPLEKLSQDECQVYLAIAARYLAQFMPDKTYMSASVSVNASGCIFTATARQIIVPGWTTFLQEKAESEGDLEDTDEGSIYSIITALKDNDVGICETITIKTEKTKPLPLYTEATLLRDLQHVAKYVKDPRIKALLIHRDKGTEGENGGIGTPATRAEMLKTLLTRHFYTVEKKKFIPTELGINFIHTLPAIATEPDMTALWHEQQQLIENGEMTCDAFLDELEIFIAQQLQQIDVQTLSIGNNAYSHSETLNAVCPNCSKPVLLTAKTAHCSACDFKLWLKLAGKTLTKTQVEAIISKRRSTEIRGFISKAGKTFSAFVVLESTNTGKVMFEFPPR